MKKNPLIIVIAVLALLFVLSVAKDIIIKVGVERGAQVVTGLKLRMGGFRVGILTGVVDIRNLRLFNPRGFKDKVMIDMPEIYVKCVLLSAMQGKLHLPEVRVDLKQFVVVKNEKGELNLNSLKVVQAEKAKAEPAPKGKAPQIRIDKLRLRIGKVVYKDYSAPGAPAIKEFNVNIDEEYSNITDTYGLVSLIVVRSLMDTKIAGLANFDLQGLKGTVSDTLGTAQKLATETVAQTKQAVETATAAAKETKEVVRQTTGALKDMLKNPFGSK